ncbi:MAG: NAD(P)-dependent oxidoreductase [Gammaproteobacteria bacterium]|nr:NAD(P)-dependent oxidoreductase [Gammaproteobacteria bacterium]
MQIGFIGLGNMGAAIATNPARARHDVAIWNRTADKARPLVNAGTTLAEHPRRPRVVHSGDAPDIRWYALYQDHSMPRGQARMPEGVSVCLTDADRRTLLERMRSRVWRSGSWKKGLARRLKSRQALRVACRSMLVGSGGVAPFVRSVQNFCTKVSLVRELWTKGYATCRYRGWCVLVNQRVERDVHRTEGRAAARPSAGSLAPRGWPQRRRTGIR